VITSNNGAPFVVEIAGKHSSRAPRLLALESAVSVVRMPGADEIFTAASEKSAGRLPAVVF